MNLLIIILFLGELKADDLVILNKKSIIKQEKPKVRFVKPSGKMDSTLEQLHKQASRVEGLLGKFQERSGVWDFTNQYDLKTGSVVKGILLNSIVSTNLESPLIVEVQDNEKLPTGTRFSCRGVTKHKRVLAACDKLLTSNDDEEFEIKAGLLNVDGSSGLRADEVSTGKEEYMAANVVTAFSKGLIELSTERIASPFGELARDTKRNRVKGGILNSLDETNNIMNSEMKTKEPKVYIEAGRPVLIYFFERFKK